MGRDVDHVYICTAEKRVLDPMKDFLKGKSVCTDLDAELAKWEQCRLQMDTAKNVNIQCIGL